MNLNEATPGEWFVRSRKDDNETVLDCFVAAPDCRGLPYDAEILGDDEYNGDRSIRRKIADAELIVESVNAFKSLKMLPQPQTAGMDLSGDYIVKFHFGQQDSAKEFYEATRNLNFASAGRFMLSGQTPQTLGHVAQRDIQDAVRFAYDMGYNDSRDHKSVPGDCCPGYRGREVESVLGGKLLLSLNQGMRIVKRAVRGWQDVVANAIGFTFTDDELQSVNANDLKNLAAAFSDLPKGVNGAMEIVGWRGVHVEGDYMYYDEFPADLTEEQRRQIHLKPIYMPKD